MPRRVIAALTVGTCGFLGVACTSVADDRSLPSSLPIQPSPSSVLSLPPVSSVAPVDADDPRPLVTVTGRSHIGEGRLDIDTPIYSLYPDGSLLVVAFDGIELVAYRIQLSIDERDEVLRLADAAGLAGGGTQPFIAQPHDVQVVDGGDGVYVRRIGNDYTVRSVAQPDKSSNVAPPERAAFVELFVGMVSHFGAATAGERVAFERWAIVRTTPTDDDLRRDLREYDGPEISDDAWLPTGSNEGCVVVAAGAWTTSPIDSLLERARLDDMVVIGRPLLPHEDDCADVAALRDVLRL